MKLNSLQMKKSILFLFIILSSQLYSQRTWSHTASTFGSTLFNVTTECQDTIIQDTIWKKNVCKSYKLDSDFNFKLVSREVKYLTFENDDLIYCKDKNTENTILLYDYSLEVGDSIKRWKVTNIDSIEILGKKRKRIYLKYNSIHTNTLDIWIEGIGSTYYGFFNPLPFEIFFESDYKFICFQDKNIEGIWQNPNPIIKQEKNCCITSESCECNSNHLGINYLNTESKIFPNPFYSTINIHHFENIINLEIISIDGKVIYTISPNKATTKLTIDMPNIKIGIYFIKILSTKGYDVFKVTKL